MTICIQIGPWLKKKELPTVKMFTTVDAKYLKEAKAALNDYLGVSTDYKNLHLQNFFNISLISMAGGM